MARDADIERRLRLWAEWLKVGDGSGYPTKCTLHSEWSPPSAGITPSMKVGAPSTARQTGRAIATLSERLQATLAVHYLYNWSMAEQAERLGCQVATLDQRIRTAHRLLAVALREQ